MKKTTMVSARVSELAAKLLELEAKHTSESKASLMEQALLSCYGNSSPEASELVMKYAAEDPTLATVLAAFKRTATSQPRK